MNIKQICKNYFTPLESLRSGSKTSYSKVMIAALKIFSYFTLAPPLVIGVTYGTVCLATKIKSQIWPPKKNSQNNSLQKKRVYPVTQDNSGQGTPRNPIPSNQRQQMNTPRNPLSVQNELPNTRSNVGFSQQPKKGNGVSLESVEQAAALENYLLGCKYLEGDGVTKDLDIASKYFNQAAKLGHIPSKAKLGELYYKADDFVKAFEYLKEHADKGEKVASCYLVAMLFNTFCTEKSNNTQPPAHVPTLLTINEGKKLFS
ncbi:hypothetical protein PHSC3_000096 [Chlamydiales bacterium STE3]|nr:hypothetical protein PHSC3_000096 [Chlamydiales bacterium STE3]